MEGVPATMEAVLLTGNGGFECLSYRTDVPVPQPGPGEVLIRVGACGVNNTDINTRTAWYSKSVTVATEAGGGDGFAEARTEDSGWTGALPQFPRIQGADAVGRIVAVGEGIDPARVGQRVLVEPVFRGASRFEATYFGSEVDGAFAQFAKMPSVHAHCIDTGLTDTELASFPCAYSAAENMLTRTALAAGERVLITGASGGVGSAAIQLAKRRGAEITALASADKADGVRALGASQVLPRDASFASESFDVVIDVAGGAGFPGLLVALKRGGRYGVAGAISGPIAELDLRTLYLKDLTLYGCTILEPQVFPNLVGYIERGEIRPIVAATFPLSEIVAAQRAFLEKKHVGKIVLIPGE
ncbi:alcohol dehydrogenase family protein [Novosphingobium sp. AAP93]|uniref:alcohol dehydrogenase family protein n=1 Tax=Novosphingobium sp. AAP93 TaxID=1523427 RepID=UPI0006B98733|nr:alcohol dehydrogenase family protein [Novosphingobium sp. AAP93]KPF88880.1 alcohol dehydrogenase [Novosphingobium sp. AAP93]